MRPTPSWLQALSLAFLLIPACTPIRFASSAPIVQLPRDLLTNRRRLDISAIDATRLVGGLVHVTAPQDVVRRLPIAPQVTVQVSNQTKVFSGFVGSYEFFRLYNWVSARQDIEASVGPDKPIFLEIFATATVDLQEVPSVLNEWRKNGIGDEEAKDLMLIRGLTSFMLRAQPYAASSDFGVIETGLTLVEGKVWTPSGAEVFQSFAIANWQQLQLSR